MEIWREDAQPGQTHDPNEVTVQMDGVGRELGDLIAERRAAAAEPDGPVFVDETGRRVRRFRRIGMTLAIGCAVYACVIVATVVSGNSSAPWLPLPNPQAEPAGKVKTSPRPAAPVEPSATRSSAPSEAAPATEAGTTAPAISTGRPAQPSPESVTADEETAPEAPAATADPKPAASRTGAATTRPGSGTSSTPAQGGTDGGGQGDSGGTGATGGTTTAPTASATTTIDLPAEPEQPAGEGGRPIAAPEDAP
ncbi:translation initiation factor IF-2 [Streptomyces sp. SID4919]|uniref:translation initiation factor IF-2 n=1 Tax=unclassified Streptomyces TaxID=2593676 RepID=UPI00118271ED|nr:MULTISPECIES: translation initiation factor IF-2 [unclassified Streptomyces]MYY10850.1 translation initiation factor IF-2 [Streptomyces sp. SID4919]